MLACLRELPIDADRFNVNGGAIALGHPLGCTGAKLTATLLYEMRRRDARYGLVTMCVGGGMGAAGIFERLPEELIHDYDIDHAVRGGAWLIDDADADTVLTRERLSEEHRLIGQTADEFIDNEVLPVLDQLEQKDWALARTLIQTVRRARPARHRRPEALGGVELDKAASLVVGEAVGRCASFATTFGAQTGLSITPLLCFGTEDRSAGTCPRLVSGELIGAYALSESGSGSDALSARARAERQAGRQLRAQRREDVDHQRRLRRPLHRLREGVDGSEAGQFTAFLVERGVPRRRAAARRSTRWACTARRRRR